MSTERLSGKVPAARPLIFFHIPKTGGVSLKAMGRNQEPPLELPVGHGTVSHMRRVYGAAFESGFRFGFVRNPFDRFVSSFSYLRYMSPDHPYWKHDRGMHETLLRFGDFRELCVHFDEVPEIAAYIHFRPMTHWVCEGGRSALNFTGRFERFDEDLRRLGPMIGLRPSESRRNASRHRPWQTYYRDERCADLVRRLYADDFETFSYSREIGSADAIPAVPRVGLSIVVAACHAGTALLACLDALDWQRARSDRETIAVVSQAALDAWGLRRRFPKVRFVAAPEGIGPGEARNIGASRALGERLVLLDGNAVLTADGLERLEQGHERSGSPLVAGCTDPLRGGLGARAHYLSVGGAWAEGPTSSPLPSDAISTGCISIARWAFERYGPCVELGPGPFGAIASRIEVAGFLPLLQPGAVETDARAHSLGALLGGVFRGAREEARWRARERRWRRRRCWLAVAGALVRSLGAIPVSTRAAWSPGAGRKALLAALPAAFAVILAGASGEIVGLSGLAFGRRGSRHP